MRRRGGGGVRRGRYRGGERAMPQRGGGPRRGGDLLGLTFGSSTGAQVISCPSICPEIIILHILSCAICNLKEN